MEFVQDNILNLVIFFPLLTSFMLMLLPGDAKDTARSLYDIYYSQLSFYFGY